MSNAHPSGLRRSVSLGIALVAALVLVFAFSVSAFAADHVVGTCDTGTPHTSIQAAVTAATSGQSIKVCNGEYFEAIDLGVKDLTIEGESEAGTIIATTPSAGSGIQGTGSYTISKLTIVGSHSLGAGRGLLLTGNGSSTVALTDVTVKNSYRTNIGLSYYASATLTNVTAENAKYGVGITFNNVGAISMSDISTSGNAWGGVSVATGDLVGFPALVASPTNSVTLSGSNSLAETVPLYVEMNNSSGNYWSVKDIDLGSGPHHVVSVAKPASKVFIFTTNAAAAATAAEVNKSAANNVAVVPFTMVTPFHVIGKNSVDSVNTFVNSGVVAQDDTVLLGSGTFAETILVPAAKRVNIVGMGSGADPILNTVVTGSSPNVYAIRLLASGANPLAPTGLANLRVEINGAPVAQGISLGNGTSGEVIANIALINVQVVGDGNVETTSTESCLRTATRTSVNYLTIVDSTFEKCESGATFYSVTSGSPACADVVTHDNFRFYNSSFSNNTYYGIYSESLSNWLLSHVTVHGNGANVPPGYGAPYSGLSLYTMGNVPITNIIIFDNSSITGNGLGNSGGLGIQISNGQYGSTCPAPSPSGVVFDGGAISGNEKGLYVSGAIGGVTFVNDPAVHMNKKHASSGIFKGDIVNQSLNPITGRVYVPASLDPEVFYTMGAGPVNVITTTVPADDMELSVSIPTFTAKFNSSDTSNLKVPVVLKAPTVVSAHPLGSTATRATYMADTSFTLTYDPACLAYAGPTGPTNIGQKGRPVHITPSTGALNIVLGGGIPVALDAGTLMTLEFNRTTCAYNATAAFGFAASPIAPAAGTVGGHPAGNVTFTGGVVTLDLNEAPTAPVATAVSPAVQDAANVIRFSQEQPALTAVGTLLSTDPNSDPLIYSFADMSSCSSSDPDGRVNFTIDTNTLRSAREFAASETGPSNGVFKMCVRANDSRGGLSHELVTVVLRVAPDLQTVTYSMAENTPINTLVGTYAATDGDDTVFTYSMDDGLGKFAINATTGDITTSVDDTPWVGPMVITIKVHGQGDPAGLFRLQPITINVTAAGEVSVMWNSGTWNAVRRTHTIPVGFAYAPGGDAATAVDFTYSFDATCFAYAGGASSNTSNSFTFSGVNISSGFPVTVTLTAQPGPGCDASGLKALRNDQTLTFVSGSLNVLPLSNNVMGTPGTLHVINNVGRGNCNSVGGVESADLTAIALEMFDSSPSGTLAYPNGFLASPFAQFAGSPFGCDANGSGHVESSDTGMAVNYLFNPSYVPSGETVTPAMNVVADMMYSVAQVGAGQVAQLPVRINSNGTGITAVMFKIKVDESTAIFDSGDLNTDGLPDGLVVNAPGYAVMAVYEESTVKVAIMPTNPNQTPLADGVIATVSLTATGNGDVSATMVEANAGNAAGWPVKLEFGREGFTYQNFIPLIK